MNKLLFVFRLFTLRNLFFLQTFDRIEFHLHESPINADCPALFFAKTFKQIFLYAVLAAT